MKHWIVGMQITIPIIITLVNETCGLDDAILTSKIYLTFLLQNIKNLVSGSVIILILNTQKRKECIKECNI